MSTIAQSSRHHAAGHTHHTSTPSLLLSDCVDWLRGVAQLLGGGGAPPAIHPEHHFSDIFGIPAPQQKHRGRMSRAERRTYYARLASREEIAEILRADAEARAAAKKRS